MTSIAENLAAVQQRICRAAERVGRDPGEIRLVAVSKTRPSGAIDQAAQAGQVLFGENYVQELVSKAGSVTSAVEWHYIGHLQSNKARQLAGVVSMIHSVDRLSLAEEISRQWGRLGSCCDVLVQVNVAQEATKSGTTAAEALSLVRQVRLLPHLRVRGLMTMPPFFDDPEGARPYFRELRLLAERIRGEMGDGEIAELSMGMSGDFEVAIEEGATLVRVGTAIFGER